MTWFRVDDGFYDHGKVIEALESKHGKGAIALWTLCGSWAGKHETDGVVSASVARRLGGTTQEIALLVSVRLWVEVDGGYRFHDWSERNPVRSVLEEKRETTRKRVSDWRNKRSGNASQYDACNAVTSVSSNAVSNAAPFPTRPDPSQTRETETQSACARRPPAPAAQGLDAEPQEPLGSQSPEAGASHVQAWTDAWGAACFAAKLSPPSFGRDQARRIATRVRGMAQIHGVTFAAAAERLAQGVLSSCSLEKSGLAFVGRVAESLDPYAPPGASQGPSRARSGRPERARATTGADFELEPDIGEQLRAHGLGGGAT